MAEEVIGAKAQHRSREPLVRDVDDLRVVVGVGHDQTAARSRHAQHLGDGRLRIGEVLEHAIRPAAVEARVLEGERLRGRDPDVAQASPPCLLDHRARHVHAGDQDLESLLELEGVRPVPVPTSRYLPPFVGSSSSATRPL